MLLREEADTPTPPIAGSSVSGEVVSILNNKILVEIDGFFIGLIAGREAVDGLGTAKKLAVGDTTQAYVVEDENADGYYILSLRKAGREKAWEKLVEMQESQNETIEVPIKAANRGGLMTEFSGIRAFIPVSQLAPEHYPRVSGANTTEILARLQKFVGQKFTVQVLAADQADNKLIFSEKAALGVKRKSAIKNLKVGDKIKGKVSGIVNFGIFILFNNYLEGLVHLSEIAWERVTDPANFARLGEDKEAVVIGVDEKKISLSIRRLTSDPWLKLAGNFQVGNLVEGTVNKITSYGVLVSLENGLSGLLHTSEISDDPDAENDLKVGEKVKAKIIDINAEDHRIALSIKALGAEAPKAKKSPAVKKKTTKAESSSAKKSESAEKKKPAKAKKKE